MLRADTDVETFDREGFLIHPARISERTVDLLIKQLETLSTSAESTTFETHTESLRAYHGCHRESSIFHGLCRLQMLLGTAQDVLRSGAYVYQFKVNLKTAFDGELWPWHQDFSFWREEDGMPAPRAVTAAVFLDDVTEFNGPMFVIPRSHLAGHDALPECSDQSSDWRVNFSSLIPYTTDRRNVRDLVAQHGMESLKGSRGTVAFFHSNIVHASAANISPLPRRIIFISYNSVLNLPTRVRRPEFLVSRETEPLEPLLTENLQSEE
jgi:Phytanoyl-CoA dioxygenase (PhyH)